MSAFSITPVTNVPPPNSEEFPSFLQWQEDGVNLGGPDADTINCSTGITATRGVGENANVITITAGEAPPPAEAAAGYLLLESSPDPSGAIFTFNGVLSYGHWVTATAVVPRDEWEWDPGLPGISFLQTGVYRIIATFFMQADTAWPTGNTTYGAQFSGDTEIDSSASAQARYRDDDTRLTMRWTDQFVLSVASIEGAFPVGLHARAPNTSAGILFAGAQITIERLGDLPA